MAVARRPAARAPETPYERPAFVLGTLGEEAMLRLRESLAAYGLKPRQMRILDLLASHGPIGQRELGQVIDIDHSILVTMLNPLEEDGYISRDRDSSDRRRHLVTITAAGRRKLRQASRALREAEEGLFASLTAAQRTQLFTLLGILRDAHPAGHQPGADCG